MQLFALDTDNKLIFAGQASKQCDYFCIECQQAVRVRSGPHRQTHYYHLTTTPSCRQNGKSMTHLQLQWHLHSLLPEGEAHLEFRFPTINRVADVAWIKEQLIFEIQCSPISAKEVQARNLEYRSQGFEVVWILHDNRFNQWRLTAAEQFLRNSPHYFTNMNGEGHGEIYDQFDVPDKGIRKHSLKQFEIELRKPVRIVVKEKLKEIPRFVASRAEQWPLFFEGDIVHSALDSDVQPDFIQKILAIEASHATSKNDNPPALSLMGKIKRTWSLYVVRPYRLLFQMLLERACK